MAFCDQCARWYWGGLRESVQTNLQGDEQRLIDALLDPAVYPWNPNQVTHLETHVSQLFFAGDRVVKIKRAVDYGFVNHLTLEARHQSCLDEVRLNRRLSDGVYLAREPIVDTGGGTL